MFVTKLLKSIACPMSDNFKFRRAESDEKIREVCSYVSETFWPHMSSEDAGGLLLDAMKKTPHKEEVYYFEHATTKKPVCMAKVVYADGFYKDVENVSGLSSTPDPSTFGVKNAQALLITFVMTVKSFRKLGLANKLITSIVSHVESELIKENLEKANKSVKGNFADMVTGPDGKVDLKLANYYLGKKYFWILYSAIGNFYERFGFKSYPIEAYKIPISILDNSQLMIDHLLEDSSKQSHTSGKKIRLLDAKKPQDRDLVSFILQNKELEILTELNKMTFHSELTGNRKSSTSITNMSEILTMSKLTSQLELTAISEKADKGSLVSGGPGTPSARRKSSIQSFPLPKFAIKPSIDLFENLNYLANGASSKNESFTEENAKYNDIQGAIFTNELQQKSHYILWATVIDRLVVLSVGEMNFNMFGAMADPMGKGGNRSRRGSSFTGLNELGGYNFQDLDILFSVACMVAKKRSIPNQDAIYISVNDLPASIPAPMINDYFLNYLPKAFDSVNSSESDASESSKVEFIPDYSKKLVLPALRKFGSNSANFDLDWVANGLWSWS